MKLFKIYFCELVWMKQRSAELIKLSDKTKMMRIVPAI